MATRGSGCLRSLLARCCHAQQRGLCHVRVQPCLFQTGFSAAAQRSGPHHRHQPRSWGCGVATSAHAQAGSPAATALEVAQESSTQGFIELPTTEESPNLERIRHSVSAAYGYFAAVAGLDKGTPSATQLLSAASCCHLCRSSSLGLETPVAGELLRDVFAAATAPVTSASTPLLRLWRPTNQSCQPFAVNRLPSMQCAHVMAMAVQKLYPGSQVGRVIAVASTRAMHTKI